MTLCHVGGGRGSSRTNSNTECRIWVDMNDSYVWSVCESRRKIGGHGSSRTNSNAKAESESTICYLWIVYTRSWMQVEDGRTRELAHELKCRMEDLSRLQAAQIRVEERCTSDVVWMSPSPCLFLSTCSCMKVFWRSYGWVISHVWMSHVMHFGGD